MHGIKMYNILLKAINRHAPLIQKKVRGRDCPWLTNNLRKAMLERNSLLKVARRLKSASDWAAYKRKRNQVNNLLRREKNSFNRKLLYDNRNTLENSGKPLNKCILISLLLLIHLAISTLMMMV